MVFNTTLDYTRMAIRFLSYLFVLLAATSAVAFQTPTPLVERLSYSSVSSSQLQLSGPNDIEGLIPIKEIVNVNIFDPNSLDPPFEDRVPQILPRKCDIYVTFRHCGKIRGKSITFDDADEAWVNLPLFADKDGLEEPLICEIKQAKKRLFFRGDKTLYTAKAFLGKDRSNPLTGMGEISSEIRDLNGDDIGLRLKINTLSTEWSDEYVSNEEGPSKMDTYFRIFMKILKVQVKNLNLGDASILQRPKFKADKDLERIVLLDGAIEYPKEDEFLPQPFSAKYVLPAMNKYLRNSERTNVVRDRASSINDVRIALHDGVTCPYEGRWVRPLSDESMHRVYFCSMGMFHIKKDPKTDGGYVADLTYLNELSYKPSLEKLGCKTFFDSNGDVVMIEDSDKTMYRPGDEFWEWAKLKSRSAAFTLTSIEHITSYHFKWACVPGLALRMFLPPSHPIRMAFSAHFFRTHYTCGKAQDSLLSEGGVLARGLPFTFKGGLEKSFIDLLGNFTFSTYPDELNSQSMIDCKFHIGSSDGLGLHNVMMDYASNLFDEVYTTEDRLQADGGMRELYEYLVGKMNGVPSKYTMANVKLVWGEILFRVTGAHNAIGNAAEYALDTGFVNFRMKEEDKGKPYSSKECNSAVAGITGITIPRVYPKLSQDWSQVLRDPKSKAYATLRTDLKKLGKRIDKRNKKEKRRFVSRDFHPDYVAISVFA